MLLASIVFVYYSVWVMVLVSSLQMNMYTFAVYSPTFCESLCIVLLQPFVATDHALHQFFMPRYYALALPIAAGALLLCAIGEFVDTVKPLYRGYRCDPSGCPL